MRAAIAEAKTRRPRSRVLMAVLGLALFASACQVFGIFGSEPTRLFPHAIHVEEGLDCTICHDGAEDRPDAGMPASERGCMLCHEEIDADKPVDLTVASFLIDGVPRWASRTSPYGGEVRFDHAAHYEAELDCEACHALQAEGEGTSLHISGGKATCLQCHEATTPRGNDCSVCHETLRLDVPPPSHAANWTQGHGVHSRDMIAGMGETSCAQCHEQDACNQCHLNEKPQSHTNFWRRRGHGLAAGIDRSSCYTCHRADYCDRCHKTAQPRSHRGAFGPPGNRHCVTCHIPPTGLNCGVCHEDFPMHVEGPNTPGNAAHMNANSPLDCLVCHVGLSHPNPGGDCRLCHK